MQQPMTDGQISRAEYEARHSALLAQVAQVEARMFAEQTALKTDVERKFDRLLDGLENLRKDLVAKDSLKPQLDAMEKRIETLEKAQLSRQELFALRMAGLAAAASALIAIFDLLIRFRLP